MVVYVLNKHRKPLMPCRPTKARILLKQGKTKVVKRTPFPIQLLYRTVTNGPLIINLTYTFISAMVAIHKYLSRQNQSP